MNRPAADASPSDAAPTASAADVFALRTRVAELQRERDNLVAMVDILQEVSAATHYAEILRTVARKLGETFDLDRCSVFLCSTPPDVRLVASYEDPTLRNLEVDLTRYPELRRAIESGETVLIADAGIEPSLRMAWPMLALRQVRSVIVVPIKWRAAVIGAIFLRTRRSLPPLADDDVRFTQVIASLTARSLKQAHRFEALLKHGDLRTDDRAAEVRRVAMLAFVRRLLERAEDDESPGASEATLPAGAAGELDRLAQVAMTVFAEQGLR